jgi:hypothetical protein
LIIYHKNCSTRLLLQPIDLCEEYPEAEGYEPEPPIDLCIKDLTAEGCELHRYRLREYQNLQMMIALMIRPYQNVTIDGECPDDFNMNEDGQCYLDKPCPTGFERRDEDKTGRCYPIDGGSHSLTPTPINIAIIVKESSIC